MSFQMAAFSLKTFRLFYTATWEFLLVLKCPLKVTHMPSMWAVNFFQSILWSPNSQLCRSFLIAILDDLTQAQLSVEKLLLNLGWNWMLLLHISLFLLETSIQSEFFLRFMVTSLLVSLGMSLHLEVKILELSWKVRMSSDSRPLTKRVPQILAAN